MDLKIRYRYVVNHWNNLLTDGKDDTFWSKYFYKGLDLLRDYNPIFCDRMEYLHKGFLNRKINKMILLLVLGTFFPQLLPLVKMKIIRIGG